MQVLKIESCGWKFTVQYKPDHKYNKYWVYNHHYKKNDYGYYTERRTLVAKYANMESCLLYLADVPDFHQDD